MNRLGKNTLILIALLLAAVVAYFSDPVLSDPSLGTEIVAPSTVSSNTTATTTQATATSTPPTATTTLAANIPPTVDVMTFRGDPFPDDHTHKINISGSKVSIRLRGLDDDDVSGFGPEVISYRSPNHEIYTYGTFDIDVHYYNGSPSTSFTLDAILNETDSDKRRLYRFESMTPLTDADGFASSGSGGQAGTSRFNNILRIWCDRHSSCLLHSFDESKLASAGETGGSGGQSRTASGGSLLAPHDASSSTPLGVAENSVDGGAFDSYEQCFRELKIAREESSKVVWSCSR